MKLRKLSVKNYKVFDHLDLDFTDSDGKTLDKIVLAGLNGTGKTTILELIRDILNGNILGNIAKDFQITVEYDLENQELSTMLFDVICEDKKWFTEGKITLKKTFLRVEYLSGSLSHSLLGGDVHLFNNLIIKFLEVFKTRTPIIYRYTHNNRSQEPTKNYVQEITFSTHKDDMKLLILRPIANQIFKNKHLPPQEVINKEINDLNQIFESMQFNSRLIDIESENLIFESANHQRIKFEDLSSGEKSLFFMGFYLSKLNVNDSIILVDEPEDSLHPTWQQQICQFYSNIGTNNQVFLATHSPYVIASVPAQNVFLLKNENNSIAVYQPKYSEGHSIPYVLSEIMDTDYRDTYYNDIVNQYLELIQEGKHETEEGQKLWEEIEKLDVNSEERLRINFSLRRFKAIGK